MILCDSNIFVYAYDSLSPFHRRAKGFLEEKTGIKGELCLTPQVLLEFFAIITKKAKNPLRADAALKIIKEIKENKNLIFIFPLETTYFRALELAKRYQRKGSAIFDFYLVATMLDNDIASICTHNVADFEKIAEITVFDPLV